MRLKLPCNAAVFFALFCTAASLYADGSCCERPIVNQYGQRGIHNLCSAHTLGIGRVVNDSGKVKSPVAYYLADEPDTADYKVQGVPAQSKIGCLGLCALEPVVQVQTGEQPPVTYGKVTPEVARRILKEHIGKGLIVQEYVIENV